MLSAHGGEIFIHTLHTSRSCLEDLPSVLESNSGKVTDYRINDYAPIIHNFKLIPLKQYLDRLPDRNLKRLRAKFCNSTKYFPLTATSTIVYNVRQVDTETNSLIIIIRKFHSFYWIFFVLYHQFLEPMLTLIGKEEITDDEILKCQQIIYNMIAFEARHEPLTLPVGQNRYTLCNMNWIMWKFVIFIHGIFVSSTDWKAIRKMNSTDYSGQNWFTCYKSALNQWITRNYWHSLRMKMFRT